jgi:acetyl-CoA synthetase
MLRDHGVKKGDRVAIYMPTSRMTVAAMLACSRIGAVHSVVFAGFSSEALASRIQDSHCVAVLTTNEAVRGGKAIDLKKTVDAAVAECASVKNVFVFQRTETKLKKSRFCLSLKSHLNFYMYYTNDFILNYIN